MVPARWGRRSLPLKVRVECTLKGSDEADPARRGPARRNLSATVHVGFLTIRLRSMSPPLCSENSSWARQRVSVASMTRTYDPARHNSLETTGMLDMCGRYVSVSTPEQLAESFEVDKVAAPDQGARYNVAPTLDVYAVIERDQQRRLGTMRWGFVPHWSKSLKGRAPINARIETVATSRMFATAFERRRCLLPADGFYEWQLRDDSDRKQPWFIHDPDDQPLALAGIWTVWRDPSVDDPDPVFSAAIVTTGARGAMADLHDRMPVVLPRTLHADWLTASSDEAPHLLRAVQAMPVPALRAHTVSDRVNNVRHDAPDLIREAAPLA